MKNIKVYLLLLFSLCLMTESFAQKGVEVAARAGFSQYFGDLNPNYKFSDLGLNLGMKFRRNFNERVGIALGFDYGKISGSDSDSYNSFEQTRDLSFTSNLIDVNFTFEFNFFPYIHGSQDYNYTPYIIGGFSFMRYNPTLSERVSIDEPFEFEEQPTYGLATGAFVYGFGFKKDFSRDYSFNIELTGRAPRSEFIDGLQGTVDGRSISRKQIGDGLTNDTVYFLNVGLVRFFSQIQCPPITRVF